MKRIRKGTLRSRTGAAAILFTITLMSCTVVQQTPQAESPKKVERRFMNLEYFPKPNGYTHVVTSPPGKMIFLSGQGGRSPGGELPEDFASQTENTFKNIGQCLEMAGATFADVVKINYYVTDMAMLGELREIRSKHINMAAPPASTLIEAQLAPGLLIEIEAIALVAE